MDLTSPFNYDLAGSQWVYTPQGIVLIEKITKGHKVLANNSFLGQELSNALVLENKTSTQIVCSNGNTLVLGSDCKLYTLKGWKEVSELKSKDYILHRIVVNNQNESKGGLPIPYIQKFKTDAMPIYVPKKMSKEFAEWIGIFLSCGSILEEEGRIWITNPNEQVIERYSQLTDKIFRLKPIVYQNPEGNRLPKYYFISKNVVYFLKDFFNIASSTLRKIPAFLLEGSNEEHLALVKGLSANARNDEDYLTIFHGNSKNVADVATLILRNNGYIVYEKTIDYRKSEDSRKNEYLVKIIGKHPKAAVIDLYHTELVTLLNQPLNVLVDISAEFNSLKVKSYHPNYSAYLKMKKSGRTLCTWSVAENLGVDMTKFDHYFDEINSIKEIKAKIKQMTLKVLYPEGFLINNIVLGGRY